MTTIARGRAFLCLALAGALVLAALVTPASGSARGERVAACANFRIQTLRAYEVQRASSIRCELVRRLLRGTYAGGGYRHTFPFHSAHGGYGNPIDWFKGGWRCSTGAGGVGCTNASLQRLNVIDLGGTANVAISASTGY